MTRTYNRSEIYNFFDLSEKQKAYVLDIWHETEEEAQEDSYVILNEAYLDENKTESEPLPLSQFMRLQMFPTDKKQLWDGSYATSAFSAYFIKLSKCGSMAVVAERYF